MRSIATGAVAAAAACLMTGTLYAANGIHITTKTTRGANAATTQVDLDANRMRVQSSGLHDGNQVFIFDGTKQVMDIVNVDAKTYNEVTKADIDRLAAQMSDAVSRMNQATANMPPEQRARVEAMMRGRMSQAGAATPSTQYRKAGTDRVGKWACDTYEGYRNGRKVAEICAADPSALGLMTSDFNVTKEMADFARKLAPQRADQIFTVGSLNPPGVTGVPVRHIEFDDNGQVTATTEITDISRQTLSDSTFQVPAGFQKQALGPMGRGR